MIRFAFLGLCALALAACTQTTAGTAPPLATAVTNTAAGAGTILASAPSANPTVAKVQTTTARLCGYVPTARTVLSVVAGLSGYGSVATIVGDVAAGFCAGATAVPVAYSATKAQVNERLSTCAQQWHAYEAKVGSRNETAYNAFMAACLKARDAAPKGQ